MQGHQVLGRSAQLRDYKIMKIVCQGNKFYFYNYFDEFDVITAKNDFFSFVFHLEGNFVFMNGRLFRAISNLLAINNFAQWTVEIPSKCIMKK